MKLKDFAVVLLDFCACLGCKKGVTENLCLHVRVDNIGDFILWLYAAKSLREHFWNKKIILIANQSVVDVARILPYWDEVIPVDIARLRRDYLYRWKFLRRTRSLRAQIVINPTYSRVLMTGDSIVRASNAPTCIGSAGDLSNMTAMEQQISARWYTRLLPAASAPMMEFRRNEEFLAGLGISFRASTSCVLTWKELDLDVEQRWTQQITEPYFVLFPGAAWSGRKWSAESYAAVADEIYRRFGWRAVLCGAEDAAADANDIAAQTASHRPMNLVGHTTLVGLIAVIRKAKLVVGNETSAIHIAAAVNTPSVCILGGGHFGRFLPYSDAAPGVQPVVVFSPMECYGCNWKCIFKHDSLGAVPCIKSISVEMVLRGAERAVTAMYGTDAK